MTAEGATAVDGAFVHDDEGPTHCYRHPDRETYIRCGRCDRPICTRCAMQGPVGFRCKTCGTLTNDPLSTFTPTQLVLGLAVAIGGGVVIGLIGGYLSWFAIVIAFFGGGIVAETVLRVIGIKRGLRIFALVIAGLIAGGLIGDALGFVTLYSQMYAGVPAGVAAEVPEVTIGAYLVTELPWLIVSIGAACVGAYTRLR